MQVNLGDIPGSLVGLGRPPLPAGATALAEAAQLPGSDPAQSPKDATVMEHEVAGDLVMGKLNRSMRKSMASKKKKGSHKSDGSARSRKSVANSDLQVPPTSDSATGPNRCLSALLALNIACMFKAVLSSCMSCFVLHTCSWQCVMNSWWSCMLCQGACRLQLIAPSHVSCSHVKKLLLYSHMLLLSQAICQIGGVTVHMHKIDRHYMAVAR